MFIILLYAETYNNTLLLLIYSCLNKLQQEKKTRLSSNYILQYVYLIHLGITYLIMIFYVFPGIVYIARFSIIQYFCYIQ